MKYIFILLAFTLVSCNSEKWAVRKLRKVSVYQPAVAGQYCAENYGTSEIKTVKDTRYVKGETIVVNDTTIEYVYVDCPDGTKASKGVKTKTIVRVDTVYQNVETTSIDKGALVAMREWEKKATNYKETRNYLWWYCGIASAAIIGLLYYLFLKGATWATVAIEFILKLFTQLFTKKSK